ncbi:MAG: Cable pili-associated 22 kDa adhesin protein [Myxococcaceae bacterium]|nr:Cable pili-associated 22 kDa adhesin protein [Myxococcaceae bacterium]
MTPPVAITPADNSYLSNTTPALSGTAPVGSTVTVVVDGAIACTTTATAQGTFSCTPSSVLPQGAHAFFASVPDGMGSALLSNTNTFTVDTVAPAAPVVLAPANGSTTSNTQPAILGTAEPLSRVTVYVDGAVIGTTYAALDGTWSLATVAALSLGSHTASARSEDKAGNLSALSALNTFTVAAANGAPVVLTPPDGLLTNDATPVISGTAAAGANVEARVDGAVVCTATAAASGAWACTPGSALSEGVHSATANVSGSTATSNSTTFRVDTVAPPVPVIQIPANGGQTGTNPTVSGTAEANSTVAVSIDGVVVCVTNADSQGRWSCVPNTTLGVGAHTVNATATDAANNVSPASPSTTFAVDLTLPDTSIVSGPPAQTWSTTATFDFDSTELGVSYECALDSGPFVTCSDPVTFSNLAAGIHTLKVRARDAAGNRDPTPAQQTWEVLPAIDTTIVSGPPALTRLAAAPFDFSSNTANVTYECSLDGSSFATCTDPATFTVPDGPHSLQVRAKASATSFDTSPATHRWTVDTLPPGAPLISSPTNGSTVGITPVAITGTGEPGSTITVVIDGVAVGTAVVDLAGTWTFTPTAALTPGPHTVTASATDPAGNAGPSSLPVTFTFDPNVLDTAIVSGPTGLTTSTSAVFDFTSNQTSVTYECSLDGAAFAPCTDPVTFSNLAQGPHTLRVRARDGIGNTDASPASRLWTIDSVAPTAAVVVSPANGATIGTATPIVTGTAEAGSTVTVVIDGVVAGTALVDANGDWTFGPTAALSAGPHTVAARATDPAGNAGPDSAINTFTVDLSALDTFIVSGPPAVSRFDSAAFDLASNQPNVTYECSLDGAGFVACTDPAAFPGLTDGSHTLRVRAKDAAGNLDPTPASFSWKVDTQAPAAPVVTAPANGATILDARPTITGTAEPGATVRVSIDGQFVGWATADASGNWSLPTTVALSEGTHTVSAVATDAVGNQGPASATNTFTVLTTALTPPTITEPADGSLTNDSTPTVKGKAPPNSTVSVFVDGVLAGTTVADANGDWTFTLATQPDGTHTVTAQAAKGGQTSAVSAPKILVIDATAPEVQIVSAPPATNLEATARFEFGSNDPAATYECSLDQGAFAACPKNHSLQGLALGEHELTVRAVDLAGNRSATKSATWTQAEATRPLQQLVGGGCGCSTVDPTALFALLGALFFAARRRSSRR